MRSMLVAASLLVVLSGLAAGWTRLPKAQRSPHETHTFVVDGSTISVDYGRPYKRGREIWGGLNAWGRVWMPGADRATILTTEHTLAMGGLTVPAGEHTIYMWVDPNAPKLIINNQVGQFHTVYNASRDLGRVPLALKTLPEPVEQLTFAVEPRAGGGGLFKLIWDNREYSVPFTVTR
jgi:hypothetical protein